MPISSSVTISGRFQWYCLGSAIFLRNPGAKTLGYQGRGQGSPVRRSTVVWLHEARTYPALMGLLGKCVPSVLFFSSNTSAFPGSLALEILRSCCKNRFRGGILVTGDWGRMERCVLSSAVVFGCSFLCYRQNRNRISNNGNDSTWCPTWFGGFVHVYSHNLGCCLLWLDWVGNYVAVRRFVVFGLIRTHANRFLLDTKNHSSRMFHMRTFGQVCRPFLTDVPLWTMINWVAYTH